VGKLQFSSLLIPISSSSKKSTLLLLTLTAIGEASVSLALAFLGITLVRGVFLVRELELGRPYRARWGTKTYDAARLRRLNRGAISTKTPTKTW